MVLEITRDEDGKPRRKRRTKAEIEADRIAAENKPEVHEIRGGEIPRKLDVDKKGLPPTTQKLPRVTITDWDDKGRMISRTYVCDPNSLRVAKNENVSYTVGGKPKRTLFISIESDVVEVEA
jgi:hypothetical protein